MRKRYLKTMGICFFLALAFQTQAQQQKSEISAVLGGGFSGLQYRVKDEQSKLQPGFLAGFEYTRFFDDHWSILSGIEFGASRTKISLSSNTVFYENMVDDSGNAFEFRANAKDYSEEQKMYTLSIPLQGQYQTGGTLRGIGFYARGGFLFCIPLSATYQAQAAELTTTGYYPDVNAEISNLPQHGFGTLENWSANGENKFSLSVSLTAEAGATFRLSPKHRLFAGGYVNYGLNNSNKSQGSAGSIITYNPTGILQSQTNSILNLAAVGNVHLMAYGLKLRMGFDGFDFF